MALVIADRVKETSTTEGVGTLTLDGATFGGFQSFQDAIGDGNTTYYCIENGSNFEIGVGTYTSSSNTLSRDTVLQSSNSDSKISTVGVSNVFCVVPAEKLLFSDEDDSALLETPLVFKRSDDGDYWQAYSTDYMTRVLSLFIEEGLDPVWKLGLKTSRTETTAPYYGYISAKDGFVELKGNNLVSLSIDQDAAEGLTFNHRLEEVLSLTSSAGAISVGTLVIDSDDSTTISNNSISQDVLSVEAGVGQVADLQVWSVASEEKANLDPDGNLTLSGKITSPSGFLDAVRFSDGTVQTTAALTSDDDTYVSGIAVYSSGQAVQNQTDIVTVSGLLGSAGSTSGIVFEKSGSNDEFRIGTTFIDSDGTQQVVRATDFNGGFLRLEVARFSPSVSAAGQSRSWDQPVTQWTVTVDNPTDFTTNYVSGVKSPLTGITGSVTSDVTLYSTSGPSVTPGGGIDWTQTFSTDGDSPIYSSTNDLTGGSASATVSFLDKNQATISETATITFNWSTASNSITFANLSGKNFLERYTTTTYNLTINNISDLSNTSTVITTNAGTLTSSTDDGTITFTTPIHKNNNSGRTITATTDFTRPATVTGTEYTSQDVSSDSNITVTFTYPSFYIFTSSKSNPPSRADIVDGFDFDSSNVTELSNELKVIDQQINNPDGVPKCWWFAVRSAASQPTTFKTGNDASLLVTLSSEDITETTVDLEPDVAPVGYNSEEYKLYGITLNPGNTYVQIS